ncbi:MAG: hypothetical protein ACXWL5_01270 [Candidatus Chromulinivorax sp.]
MKKLWIFILLNYFFSMQFFASNQVVDTIPLEDVGAFQMLVNQEGTVGYALGFVAGLVFVVDLQTNTVIQLVVPEIYSSVSLYGAFSLDQTKIYQGLFQQNQISILDVPTKTYLDPIVSDWINQPFALALSVDGQYLYVSNFGNNDIIIVDTQLNQVVNRIQSDLFHQIYYLAITPDGSKMYVCNSSVNNQVGTVSIVNLQNNTVIGNVDDPDNLLNNPWFMTITTDGTRGYVSNFQQNGPIAIIDIATNRVVGKVLDPYGYINYPFSISLTTDGTRGYVTNLNDQNASNASTIAIFDVNGNVVLQKVTDENPPTLHGSYVMTLNPANTFGYACNLQDQIISVIQLGPITIATPINIQAITKINQFLMQKSFVNVISWQYPAYAIAPVGYKIFTDAGLVNQIGYVSATTVPLQFLDFGCVLGKQYNYYVVAVDADGNQSLPAFVQIRAAVL